MESRVDEESGDFRLKLPKGVTAARTHRFDDVPTMDEISSLMSDGRELAKVAGIKLLPLADPDTEAPGKEDSDDGIVWVVAVNTAKHPAGTEVELDGQSKVGKQKGIAILDGEEVFIEKLDPSDDPVSYADRKAAEVEDARVIAIEKNSAGKRGALWRNMVGKFTEEAFSDWPLQGPRTLKWCIEWLNSRDGGAKSHHRLWLSGEKLQPTDWGVNIHEVALRVLQHAVEYDMLDVPNIAGLELLVREAQMVEFHYVKKKREQSKKDGNHGLVQDEMQYFRGNLHQVEHMICPALIEYASTEIGKEADRVKQFRKAREESRLAEKK